MSPTADCVTAVSWMVERAIKRSHSNVLRVVVRTQSCEGESADSNEVELSVEMFNFKVNQLIKPKGAEPLAKKINLGSQGSLEGNDHSPLDESNLANDASAAEEQREMSDSVRRYSRDESGQPHLVIVNDSHKEETDHKGDSTPLAQHRTKGEPVVWKYDEEADDESESADNVTKSDVSESEDEEQVEICIPEFVENNKVSTEKEPEVNVEEQDELLDNEGEEAKEEEEEVGYFVRYISQPARILISSTLIYDTFLLIKMPRWFRYFFITNL